MDLISREAIKKYISAPCTYVDGKRIFYEEDLDLIGSPFEGMTYGEVIKAVLPNITFQKAQDGDSGEKCVIAWTGENVLCEFPLDFWDSPYKGVSE